MTDNYTIEAIPVAPLKLAAHISAEKLAKEVDKALVEYRRHDLVQLQEKYSDSVLLRDFAPDSFLLDLECPRFGTGEAKGVINESVRGVDEFILCDITNYSNTYTVCGFTNHMSPDDNYQDLKRIIGASVAKAHRVNVIMPFLYESRQHKREKRESLDCAMALEELVNMGVKNIITFDAHDPRVQNSIPLNGFDSFMPTYAFVKAILRKFPDLQINKDTFMVISPDEGAMGRAVFLANNLGVDMGMFYKRRDYSKVVNGRNPIVAHEFLGASVKDKTVLIVDDMISSGDSMLEVAGKLKDLGANKIYVCCSFGLFCNGLGSFDIAYQKGLIADVYTTNTIYQTPELLSRPWYQSVDMSKFLAYILDAINHDVSIGRLLDPSEKINLLLEKHKGSLGAEG